MSSPYFTRRNVVALVPALMASPVSAQEQTHNSDGPLEWLVSAILSGSSEGIERYVASDATVPSDLVNSREEFGWWIVELNAKMARGYSTFDLRMDAKCDDNEWLLAFLTMTVTNRDSGNDATHDWHVAATLANGQIDVLHIAYWV